MSVNTACSVFAATLRSMDREERIRREQGRRLKAARVKAGYRSARDAALQNDWKESSYRAHEGGTRTIGRDDAERYAKRFSGPGHYITAKEILFGPETAPLQGAEPPERPIEYRTNPVSALAEVAVVTRKVDVRPPDNGNATVPLVGYVGAGGQAQFSSGQGPFGEVEAPRHFSPQTVAVEVRGDSMPGIAEDRWLLYYDDVRDPPAENLLTSKNPVVAELDDGRVLVKRIRKGSAPGLYHLLSPRTEDSIFDAKVRWAARVTWIRPRWD